MANKDETKTQKESAPKKRRQRSSKPVYHENRRLANLNGKCPNATDTPLILDSTNEAMEVAQQYLLEYRENTSKWEATAQYGRQHFNQDGFCHPDGVVRFPNRSIAMLLLQAAEVLAERASHEGDSKYADAIGPGGDPAEAAKVLRLIRRFVQERPDQLKEKNKERSKKAVAELLGVNPDEIVSASKPPQSEKPKPKKKTTTQKKVAASKAKSKSEAPSKEKTTAS